MRLSHISIKSKNLERDIFFYKSIFDVVVRHVFKSMDNEIYGYFLEFTNGGLLEVLHDSKCQALDNPSKIDHFCVEVDDIFQFKKKLPADVFSSEIKRGRTDKVLQMWVRAPDETKIEIHQFDSESSFTPR
jgi:catechol 2,3-dioxygenase-like lactoylglutathione lyase family enzyme